MRYQSWWKVLLAPIFSKGKNLAGNSQYLKRRGRGTTFRMCSNVLTESPMKLVTADEPAADGLRGRDLVNHAMRSIFATSPAKSPKKREADSQSSAPQAGLSLLPASLLLQKSFGLIASEAPSEKRKRSRPFTVSIEGNIGSGKSTFLQYFSALPGVATYQEPLNLWTNLHGHNLLGKLYEDPKRWSFLFQSYVQLTRLNIHLQQCNSPVKLIERSLQNNRYCFVESGHDSGELHGAEYSVLCEYYDLLESNLDIGIDLIVYLRSTPETVHSRMLERGRSEEAGVPLGYLKQVHNYYENWLLEHKPRAPPAPVLVIDADKDLEKVKEEYRQKKEVIMGEKPL
ncbi:deoxynucleoside kinase-like [Penaeus chinensis]|uniref:deoxynucleoside kinase-like n=1 Tax=Penaeus chinensis TaxID=139456 RepID=UPI001FB831E7|nr:deoxynucleoside kinase-like [Penaeus chinensis]